MTTTDTWILVSVPARSGSRGLAARAGLALLAWSEQRRDRTATAIDLTRVARPLPSPRPFC